MSTTSRTCQLLTLVVLFCGLIACSGEPPKGGASSSSGGTSSSSSGKPSSSSTSSSGKPSSSSSSSSSSSTSGGTICDAVYNPVCSVVRSNIQCITTPCPIGAYKTFSNRCASDAASATWYANGACGEREDQPAYNTNPTCTDENKPVCGTAKLTAPCTTAPCPAVVYKSYTNSCVAAANNSLMTNPGSCGGVEGKAIQPTQGPCITLYSPQCALAATNKVCITAPCPTHVYKTFGNSCETQNAVATPVFNRECGALEGVTTSGQPPVKLVKTLPKAGSMQVSKVQFKGDILALSLGYSGCKPIHYELYVSDGFKESNPVQVNSAFVPVVADNCLAVFNTEYVYDLTPLKHAFQTQYQTEHGTIVLQGIGEYTF